MNAFEEATQSVTEAERVYVEFAVIATDRTGEVLETVCFRDRAWDARWTAREMLNYYPGVKVEIVAKNDSTVFTYTNYEE